MGVLTKYDQIEPIYLSQSLVTHIYLHSVYIYLDGSTALWDLASFQFSDLFTIGRTPWTSDQIVTRPLPEHRTAKTQNKHIYTPNIHALCGIRTHDNSVRASEVSSCLRPLGYRERLGSISGHLNLSLYLIIY
jgi:hypothetical protein